MPLPALAGPKAEVMAALGVSEAAFEGCRDRDAVACRVVLFGVLVHHCGQDANVARDFLSIPPLEAAKIAELFRTYFLIYAVPRTMRSGALALNLRNFLAGKEGRIDFAAFMRRRPRLRIAPLEILERRAEAKLSMDEIIATVSDYLDVPKADIKSDRRSPHVIRARHVAVYACRLLTSASMVAIGRAFGGRDHSTVIHACKSIETLIGGRPHEGLDLIGLLDHIAGRVPAVAAQHAAASSRAEKQENTFSSSEIRDSAYLRAA